MALKVLLLRKKLTEKQNALAELERAAQDFATREAELEADIAAAESEEERTVVEEAVEAFEQERSQNETDRETLRIEIEAMEAEIREAEDNAKKARSGQTPKDERKDENTMNTVETRTRFFNMTTQQRDAFVAREDVKEFLQRVRELGNQKRSVTGADLLIPTVVLDLLRENIGSNSKLMRHVNLRSVPGKARQVIAGAIPEGIWTEACATLNELDVSFTSAEVDGFKVGGFIAICNAVLEDSDIALAQELISMLAAAIGRAVDKAILYGTGNKMPMGIVTRLAQTAAPESSKITRPWANLSTSNIVSISAANSTGTKLFQSVLKAFGAAKSKYSRGVKFWAMNETTYNTLQAEAMGVNASGALVAGMNNTMPVVGGAVEILDFIPDNNIVAGYGDLYLLAERAGASVAQSEHARFVEDQTVFKGTARYDGLPVIAEGFVAIGINGATPATSLEFAGA